MREGWSYKKLGEVCKTTSGGTPSKAHNEYYEGGTIPWLRSGEVKQGAIFETEMFITEEGLNNSSAKIVPEDSVAVAMYGATVGQVGIIKAPMCTNQAICCILPSKELLPDYLYRFLSSKKEEYLKNAIGGAQPNISQAEIKKTLVSIPPLTTQQQIVSELDLLSHILDQKRQQLKEYDALAESIFYDMFGDESKFKKEKLVKLTTKIGSGATPKGGNQAYKDEGISLIRSLNVHNAEFKYEDLAHIDEEQAAALNNVTLEKNDVLFNITGASVTRCCIVPENVLPARVNQHVAILRSCTEVLNYIFLSHLLISSHYHDKLYALSRSNGATREAITKAQLENFVIPLPPLDLQHSFATKIESIEHQKQLLKESIKETEMLFQSRMDYWFNS